MRVLVVGGGLAGLCLSQVLMERGNETIVITSDNKPASTSLSTGMYNPIVFRRLNKSWMIEELERVFLPFYDAMSDLLEVNLRSPIRFVKRIPSKDYLDLWNRRASEAEFRSYMAHVHENEGEVLRAGMVNAPLFMQRMQWHLKASDVLRECVFDESLLEIEDTFITYNGERFDRVVMATGAHEATSKLFGWLPFNICKGEWIRIRSEPNLTAGRVINNILNIIPEGDGIYKLSSTYTWKNLDWNYTQEAADELCSKFTEVFPVPFEIIERQAGLRPTVADRRPYLGRHPEHKPVFIFNGLGSKAIMLAPYFANHLADHLLLDTPLLPEVNIARHFKRYAKAD